MIAGAKMLNVYYTVYISPDWSQQEKGQEEERHHRDNWAGGWSNQWFAVISWFVSCKNQTGIGSRHASWNLTDGEILLLTLSLPDKENTKEYTWCIYMCLVRIICSFYNIIHKVFMSNIMHAFQKYIIVSAETNEKEFASCAILLLLF